MNTDKHEFNKETGNLEINSNPTADEIEYIKDGLKTFNDQLVGDDCHRPLSFVVKNARGDIAGGVVGGTYWGWLNIDRFWIKSEYRKQGLGSRLLWEIEREAMNRGCCCSHLDTHDFQALGFYLKHGYEIKAELKDLPPGHSKYLLWKRLA